MEQYAASSTSEYLRINSAFLSPFLKRLSLAQAKTNQISLLEVLREALPCGIKNVYAPVAWGLPASPTPLPPAPPPVCRLGSGKQGALRFAAALNPRVPAHTLPLLLAKASSPKKTRLKSRKLFSRPQSKSAVFVSQPPVISPLSDPSQPPTLLVSSCNCGIHTST